MKFANRIGHFFQQPTPKPLEPKPPATALEERQQLLAHHVRLTAKRMTNGLCVYGSRGGLGKSKVILDTLRQEGVQPVILSGHCTPLSLYMNLFHNPDATIFLDDCDGMLRNLPTLGLLRSALWGDANDHRLVTYNSSQLKIPSRFFFTGRVIFAINSLPCKRNHAFAAVLSRVDQFELDASNYEVIELMTHLAKQGFDGLSPMDCLRVVNFIAEFSSTRELSLRLLIPSFRKVLYAREAGVDWRDLVRSQLEQIGKDDTAKPLNSQSNDTEYVREALRQYPDSVEDQASLFVKLSGKSRATFFRLKKKLN
ncbi:MAG: hypothetical protein HQ567_22210 [Candidatus Nealsonbacteria bacterium]|nr:hypothetical protein [Candidatus Nealsonbacteria bacterium]